LVFMDCDSEIVSNSFAKSYVNAIGKAEIIYGGTAYQKGRPEKIRLLHWKYGRSVESQSLKKRLQNPFMSFRSNNFMIARWVFVKHLFDTTIDGYGYEDNVFAEGLKEAKYNIWHIDNPLLHDGLETNEAFLNKTNQALDNLAKLYQEKKLKTRLTKTYDRWTDNGFLSLFNFLNKFSRKKRYQRLLNNKAGLMSFQLYKLDYFMNLVKDDK